MPNGSFRSSYSTLLTERGRQMPRDSRRVAASAERQQLHEETLVGALRRSVLQSSAFAEVWWLEARASPCGARTIGVCAHVLVRRHRSSDRALVVTPSAGPDASGCGNPRPRARDETSANERRHARWHRYSGAVQQTIDVEHPKADAFDVKGRNRARQRFAFLDDWLAAGPALDPRAASRSGHRPALSRSDGDRWSSRDPDYFARTSSVNRAANLYRFQTVSPTTRPRRERRSNRHGPPSPVA